MHILFLDDQDVRHELAEKYLSAAGHIVLHAFNVEEGIELVECFAKPIGLALLDHDLDDIREDRDGRKTEYHGAYFVDYMIRNVPQDKWFHRAIIHSYNPHGAKYMRDTLNKNGIHAKMDNFSGDMLKRVIGELSVQ
jgi:CheY-like chemotaxis protein